MSLCTYQCQPLPQVRDRVGDIRGFDIVFDAEYSLTPGEFEHIRAFDMKFSIVKSSPGSGSLNTISNPQYLPSKPVQGGG